MQKLKTKILASYELKPLHKLIGRIKLSDFMDLNEEEFKDFIKNIESTPLFKKLMYPLNRQQKIIRFKTYSFQKEIEFKDNVFISSSFSLENILEENKDLLEIIKKWVKKNLKNTFFLFSTILL